MASKNKDKKNKKGKTQTPAQQTFGKDAPKFEGGTQLAQQYLPERNIPENATVQLSNGQTVNPLAQSYESVSGTVNDLQQNGKSQFGIPEATGAVTSANQGLTTATDLLTRAIQRGISPEQQRVLDVQNALVNDAEVVNPAIQAELDRRKLLSEQGLNAQENTALREAGAEGLNAALQVARRQAMASAGARGVGGGAGALPVAAINDYLQQRRNLERDILLENIGFKQQNMGAYENGLTALDNEIARRREAAAAGLGTATNDITSTNNTNISNLLTGRANAMTGVNTSVSNLGTGWDNYYGTLGANQAMQGTIAGNIATDTGQRQQFNTNNALNRDTSILGTGFNAVGWKKTSDQVNKAEKAAGSASGGGSYGGGGGSSSSGASDYGE